MEMHWRCKCVRYHAVNRSPNLVNFHLTNKHDGIASLMVCGAVVPNQPYAALRLVRLRCRSALRGSKV